ncbi:MAG: hypothetical protein ACI392_04130 [Paludibacteraceae bacterium]
MMIKKFLIGLFIVFLCTACSEDSLQTEQSRYSQIHAKCAWNNDDDGQNELYNIQFCDTSTLERLRRNNSETILDYKFARKRAFIEFLRSSMLWNGDIPYREITLMQLFERKPLTLSISNRPVVVYDYEGVPYYYEFAITWGEQVLTIITVYARPIHEELIAYVGAVSYGNYDVWYDRFIGQYPSVYYGSVGTGEYYKLTAEGELEISNFDIPTHPYVINNLQNLANIMAEDEPMMLDDYNEYLADNEENNISPIPFSVALSRIEEYIDSNMNYWMYEQQYDTDTAVYFTLSASDYMIIENNLTAILETYSYFIQEYTNNELRFTRWRGDCGPSAMCWLYRGKYSYYGSVYIPIFGNQPSLLECFQYDATYSYAFYEYNDCDMVDSYSPQCDGGLYKLWHDETLWESNLGCPLTQSGMNIGLSML